MPTQYRAPLDGTPEGEALVAGIRELIDLEQEGARLPVNMGPYTAFLICGAIQFAMRHPDFSPGLGAQLRHFVDSVQDSLVAALGSPVARNAAESIALGWDLTQDAVPVDDDEPDSSGLGEPYHAPDER